MHGGLARWLRAAGYDVAWQYGIEDRALLERARTDGRIILTSDGQLLERRVLRRGEIRAVFVPRGLDATEALGHVLEKLGLPVRKPRCMTCGGALDRVPKESVEGEAPARTYAWLDVFYRCRVCGKLFWEGTHWQSIQARLSVVAPTRAPKRPSHEGPESRGEVR
jgi:uncharacterized protein with PIN domain